MTGLVFYFGRLNSHGSKTKVTKVVSFENMAGNHGGVPYIGIENSNSNLVTETIIVHNA